MACSEGRLIGREAVKNDIPLLRRRVEHPSEPSSRARPYRARVAMADTPSTCAAEQVVYLKITLLVAELATLI